MLVWVAAAFAVSFTLISPKSEFAEEESVILHLVAMNDTSAVETLSFHFLQPKEFKWIYVGEEARLEILGGPAEMARFTNHMPPEPKPHSPATSPDYRPVVLEPGQRYEAYVPFFWDYYPVILPCKFTIRFAYREVRSNPVSIKIYPTKGKSMPDDPVVNGDFSEKDGSIICGWKLWDPATVWDNEEKALKYTLSAYIAANDGLWVNSIFYPVQSPCRYILSVRFKSAGPCLKPFVEGWGMVAGRRRRIERNEVITVSGTGNWQTYQWPIEFTKPDVRWIRIKLYTYGVPGNIWFNQVKLEKISNNNKVAAQ